ncbi:hypothetical protein ACHAPI_011082 [Fusarium lateritium]
MARARRKSRKGITRRPNPQLLVTELLRREEASIQSNLDVWQARIHEHRAERDAHQACIDMHQGRLEKSQTRLADIQALLAADGDERPPAPENAATEDDTHDDDIRDDNSNNDNTHDEDSHDDDSPENEQDIPFIVSSYELEVFHPDRPSLRRLVNTQPGSEHQDRFCSFMSNGGVWGNVTCDEDLLRMSSTLRMTSRCTGTYTRMDPIDHEKFEAARKDCTAVRVTYDSSLDPERNTVAIPPYLAPGDPLPVHAAYGELDSNAGSRI